jgi:hypothetical protein
MKIAVNVCFGLLMLVKAVVGLAGSLRFLFWGGRGQEMHTAASQSISCMQQTSRMFAWDTNPKELPSRIVVVKRRAGRPVHKIPLRSWNYPSNRKLSKAKKRSQKRMVESPPPEIDLFAALDLPAIVFSFPHLVHLREDFQLDKRKQNHVKFTRSVMVDQVWQLCP